MQFSLRKKNQLSKIDKSNEGKWDNHILDLCEKINKHEEYCTTSSCSGRVVITKADKNKSENAFLFKSHEKITFKELKYKIEEIKNSYSELAYFKSEPCILAVSCDNLEDAEKLMKLAQESGWKRSAIISASRFIVELMSTEKLEFPILDKGNILVDDNFLRIIVDESNKKLEKSWEKIKKLENFF